MRPLLVPLAAFAALLAGCSSPDDVGAPTTQPTTTEPATASVSAAECDKWLGAYQIASPDTVAQVAPSERAALLPQVDEAAAGPPAGLDDEFALLADVTARFAAGLDDIGWDPGQDPQAPDTIAAGEQLAEMFEAEEVLDAHSAVEAYLVASCVEPS